MNCFYFNEKINIDVIQNKKLILYNYYIEDKSSNSIEKNGFIIENNIFIINDSSRKLEIINNNELLNLVKNKNNNERIARVLSIDTINKLKKSDISDILSQIVPKK